MRALRTLVALLLLGSQAHSEPEWTYSEGALEEESWPLEYPACGGQRQSPINLQRKKVQYNPSLQVLELKGYDTHTGEFSMTNNGHTVQVSLPPTMRMTTSDGTEYIAKQMHYHWGGASSEVSGSEHTVDGIRRVIEVHMVHYNSKYESYDVAKDAPDGLAVLATFVEINDYGENTYYSQLISQLDNIIYPGQVTTLRDLNIRDMLPEDVDHYYTYQGSLTTPPCSENVLWFVLANSVFISRAQVWKMENTVLNHLNETLQNGYRSTQPLNQRVVEANFLYHPTQPYVSRPEFQSHLSSINSKLESLERSVLHPRHKVTKSEWLEPRIRLRRRPSPPPPRAWV